MFVLTLSKAAMNGGFLLNTVPVIPGALMNTLPFRLSFPFVSTERPRLKMDLHFLDFPDSFLLTKKKKLNPQLPLSGFYNEKRFIRSTIMHALNNLSVFVTL